MDSIPEMSTPQDPLPTTRPIPNSIQVDKPLTSRQPLALAILILALGAVAIYFLYPKLSQPSGLPSQTSPPPSVVAQYDPVPSADKKLVYLRQPDPDTPASYEAWLIDPVTGQEAKLPLSGFTQAYKHYGSSLLFYRPIGEEGLYRVLDLATGIEQSHKLITHPDPLGRESVNMDNIRMISPDNKHLVFYVDFFKPCPSPSPFPSGFEGGYGPCTPDENLATPYGYYLYDLEERTSIYLGELIRVSRWDIKNKKLYYTKQSSTKVLDLATKSIVHLDASSYFGYFTYPLLASNQLVSQEGSTGDTGNQQAFSKISLVDIGTKKQIEIDKADGWAIIQPFLTASPDDQNVVYTRTYALPGGINPFTLFKYNVADKKTARLTPEDNKTSYRYYGEWIDNHTYVTAVDTIEDTTYTNTNNYLVKIDVETGEITRLTPHDLVYSYASQ